ncbi:MAG: hypothetical protein AB8B53_01815 [Flavobacteriales bacterium]
MKKYAYILVLLSAVVMSFNSCTIRQKAVPLTPINAQVNIDFDDLEYMGDIVGTSEQSYALGVIAYGGRKYHAGTLLPQGGLGIVLPNNRGVNNALYDALQQMPDADMVLPVSFERVTDQQFLGRRVKFTVRCKAYKIKNK